MKKITYALAILFFILPSVSSAAALTQQQSTSLIAVVQSSPGTPASAFISLITAFSNITTNQAASLITVVQSAPGVPANAFVNLLTSFTVDTSTTQTITPAITPTVTPSTTSVVPTATTQSTTPITQPTLSSPSIQIPKTSFSFNGSEGTANTYAVKVGDTVRLGWSTQYSYGGECTASGDWNGKKIEGNSENLTFAQTGTFNYILTCLNGRTAERGTSTATITVTAPVAIIPQTEVKFETGLRPLGGGSAYDAYVFYNRTNKYVGYSSVAVKVWRNTSYTYTSSTDVVVKMENDRWSLMGSVVKSSNEILGTSEDTATTVNIPLTNPSNYYCGQCGFYVAPTTRADIGHSDELHFEAQGADSGHGVENYVIKFVSFGGETFGTKPTYPGSGGTIYTFD